MSELATDPTQEIVDQLCSRLAGTVLTREQATQITLAARDRVRSDIFASFESFEISATRDEITELMIAT